MIHIHRAERADALVDALAELLSDPLPDPFAAEVVAVPTRGMERWLTQRMSSALGAQPGRGDGICANVVFPSPHRLAADAVAVASGIDPETDPWLPERAVWPLVDIVGDCLVEPWLAALAAYLGADRDPPDEVRAGRRLTVLRHIAGLYHRYALHRPDMMTAWAAGRDESAQGSPLGAEAAWQAELWRRLRRRISSPDPAARAEEACRELIRAPQRLALPSRLALFGLTRLPAGHLQILRALGRGRDVHLFLLHPSPGLWARAGARLSGNEAGQESLLQAGTGQGRLRRAADPTASLARHRLLASWGRDAREMQCVLGSGVNDTADHHHPPSQRAGPPTLLSRVQDDVRADRPAPGEPLAGAADGRAMLDHDDRSVQVHSCHGRARQVEVVRDAVLHALAADPTLEPRDVIVMCPDIETFAPLIEATFGAAEAVQRDADGGSWEDEPDGEAQSPPPVDLRVRLADRALLQTNPVLGAVSALLQLAHGRVTASQVLDLSDRAPVRRRFALDDDDRTRLASWISQSGIRWGLDAEHRAPYRLEGIENGTWRAGLDRLLLGVTMTEDGDRLFADVLPLDDVDSRAIDLAGRLAELVDRLGVALQSFTRQPLSEWARAIAEAADGLTAVGERDRWQRAELERILDEMIHEAGATAAELSVGEMRALLADRLAGRPTRANFRTGHLTVCTLVPMRSVPHRVVCLLGLDDGAFPRRSPRDGDDLLLGDPLVGERDPRSEDRQLLLDATMAATERLIITYTGNDERTNAPRPPAVPVGELLDTVDATCRSDAGPAREQVVVRHPLQPFDPRNFIPGALAGPEPWSFDPIGLAGAVALSGSRLAPAPFLRMALPPRPERVLELSDLVRFLEHPVRAFLRQRLGIGLRLGVDEIQDGMAVELDGLGRWAVGQRLLEARLRGVDGRSAIRAEIARGSLPPGVLGEPVIRGLYPIVDAICAQAAIAGGAGQAGDPVDVRVMLKGERLVTGTVAGVSGDTLLSTSFSRVSPRHRLAAWARLLALTAACPERPFAAATVGRGTGADDVRMAWIEPLGGDPAARRAAALHQLGIIVDLYERGMREPLPLACRSSAAYAAAALGGQDAVAAARGEWETEWRFEREDRDLEHQLAFGGVLPLEALLQRPALTGAGDEDLGFTEATRFGRYARRLWDGLLAAERVSAR